MSISIPQSFVDQFSANVHMLAEQRTTRLRPTIMEEPVTGESFSRDRVGTTQDTANSVTDRHGDTPLNNTPHSRRWGYIKDFDVADLIDRQDRVKLLIDPSSVYTMRHGGVMGRSLDDEILDALSGDAAQGRNGSTTVALPSAQKIPSGSTGLTVAKLIQTKEILDEAEIDPMFTRYYVASAKDMSALLNDDRVTSADFNTIKALVRGEINEYMGFQFIRLERPVITNSGSSTLRTNYAYAQPAVTLGVAEQPQSIASPRPDKRMAQQIYTYGSWGAVRVEDEMVVEVSNDYS
jgi:hypothetical protein